MLTTRTGDSTKLFRKALANIVAVLKDADKHDILTSAIPVDFLERDPEQISTSYAAQEGKGTPTTTIWDKFEKGSYKTPYTIYHDIRLACFILINSTELGSESYVEMDRFYKLGTELLLRECYRLNISIKELKDKRLSLEKAHEESSFEEMLDEDFDSITTAYSVAHSELYMTLTQNNVPLFTSLNNRSALDERQTLLPDNIHTSKVIPNTLSDRSRPLGQLSPQMARLQQQQEQPSTQILNRFLHPNWYSLPTSKWLESSDLQSFGPIVDEQGIVVSSQDKGRLWLEHIGYKQLQKWKQVPFDAAQALNGENDEDMREDVDDEEEDDEEEEEEVSVMDVDEEPVSLQTEDYFNIYEWSAYNCIEDEEIKAFEDGSEQHYLSQQLQKLQSLRTKRFARGSTQPSDEESSLHFQCFRLLKDIMITGDVVPDVKHSVLLPTEQFIYTGSLPVPQQNAQPARKKYKTRTR